MIGRQTFALRVNQRFFYGWLIVAIAAVGIFASGPGQSHLFSVYFPLITRDLGISQTGVAFAYGAATLIAALALSLVGRAVDRFGARPVVLVVAVLMGFAAIGFGRIPKLAVGNVETLLALGLGFAGLRFLGQGSLMLCCNNMVAQWFHRRRGFALSIMSWGFAASVAVHPSLARVLSEAVGWPNSWFWLGVITWVLLLPLLYWFVWSKPEDLHLGPDGDSKAAQSSNGEVNDLGMTLNEAQRTRVFWIVGGSLMSLSGLVTALFLFQVSILEAQGVPSTVAVGMFTVSAITMVVFVPVFGRLLDRVRTERVFAAGLATMSVALMAASQARGTATAVLYALVFGLANAAMHAHYVYLWARYFGRKHLGSIQGFAQFIGVVGASLGGLPLGWAWDRFGSYGGMLQLMAAVPILFALLVLTVDPPDLRASERNC